MTTTTCTAIAVTAESGHECAGPCKLPSGASTRGWSEALTIRLGDVQAGKRPGSSSPMRTLTAHRIKQGSTATSPYDRRQIKLVFSLAVLFLLTHPYTGIRHDAVLYTAQALKNAYPANFARDLFFQFGSQDDWSIYGRAYGKLVTAFGIRASNLLGLIVAQAVWWTGMWRLTRKLLPGPWSWFCLFLAASMPAEYGAGSVLSYDEIFLTARLPAEGLGLWALALTLERRQGLALAAAGIATATHPIIGVAALAVVLLNMMPRMSWWRIFLIALTAFCVVQLSPFPLLHLQPFDPEWRGVARFNLSFLFPSLWNLNTWSKACWAIAMPAVLCAIESGEQRKFWEHLTLAGLAGLGICTAADIIGQDATWIQLQSWRVLWLLTLMQWPASAILLYREARAHPVLIWLLAICWLTLDVGGGIIALSAAAVLHIVSAHKPRAESAALLGAMTPLCRNALIAATLIAIPLWLTYQGAYYYVRVLYWTGSPALNLSWLEALVHTRLIVVLVAVLIVLNLSCDAKRVAVLYLLLITLLSYGLINIDQRSGVAKIMEARVDQTNLAPFAGKVVPGDIVYWDGPPDEVVYPWFLMKTSSYFSPAQAAGMIFHRLTTFEVLRRISFIDQDSNAGRPHGKDDNNPDLTIFSNTKSHVSLSKDGLNHACQDPVLDFVVSRTDYPDLSTQHYWAPDNQLKYWLYDCRKIRTKDVPISRRVA
jgi:hypothetical protein